MRRMFQTEEAEQILRQAVRRDEAERNSVAAMQSQQIPAERLREMAHELEVAPEILDAVLQEQEQQRVAQQIEAKERDLKNKYISEKWEELFAHFAVFVSINFLLVLAYLLFTPNQHPWFIWPLLGWGIELGFEAAYSLPTRGEFFEKEFAKWKRKRQRRTEKQAKRRIKIKSKAEA